MSKVNLSVETAPNPASAKRTTPSALGWTALLFLVLWAAFYEVFEALPYVSNGSDVVFAAKLRWEEHGQVFPADHELTRVLIFGNSKILAGFLPALFDQLGLAKNHKISSFNSGFPGSDLFLPPLRAMCQRGQAPQVLLLTLPWNSDPPPRGIFHFETDDHAVIDKLFPFRNFPRDLTAFLLNAPTHGGVARYYRDSQENERAVIQARGYHLIAEQSRFAEGRLPDDFHLSSDQPTQVVPRVAPAHSAQIAQLNQLLQSYNIACFYVPLYLREGEAAPAPARDEAFAAQLARTTACKLLGPDYYLYPNRLFADQTHLNQEGARVYTEALFALLKDHSIAIQ